MRAASLREIQQRLEEKGTRLALLEPSEIAEGEDVRYVRVRATGKAIATLNLLASVMHHPEREIVPDQPALNLVGPFIESNNYGVLSTDFVFDDLAARPAIEE